MKSKIIFSKYSNNRKDEFRIVTSIYKDNEGKKWVEKRANHPKAQKHIDRIKSSYDVLIQYNNNPMVKINSCVQDGNSIRFEYINGKLFSNVLTEILVSGDYTGFVEKVKEYVKLVKSLFPLESFEVTEEFKNVFGDIRLPIGLQAGKFSNIDFTFDNIIINYLINVIDYEWVFNFPIPINYIIYRAINVYVTKESLHTEINLVEICRLLEISKEEISLYNEMESNFQRYVNKEEVTLKPPIKLEEILAYKAQMQHKPTVQVFKDYGEGFSEQNSERIEVIEIQKGVYKIIIGIEENVKYIRIDPIEDYCILQIESAIAIDKQSIEILPYVTNATEISGNLIFNHMDPQVIFEVNSRQGILEIVYKLDHVQMKVIKVVQELYIAQQKGTIRNQELQKEIEDARQDAGQIHNQNQQLIQSIAEKDSKLIELENQIQSKTEICMSLDETIEKMNEELIQTRELASQTGEELDQTREELVQVREKLRQAEDELLQIKSTKLWKIVNKIRK